MLPWQGTKQSIRDRIGNNVDVYGYGNKRCVCCFFPAVHPAPVQPPPDLLNAVLARVATEKRVSLVKAWEESERSKAENKYNCHIGMYKRRNEESLAEVQAGL
ncbi:uncharacterized protein [Arachis hypogaea]|uniref:uncharacterized protein n=1 Tax=Arachis hypogaea TaxID=3818 RepID=UPI003B215160